MKKSLIILIMFLTTGINGFSQTVGDTLISNNPKNLRLKVYYFHITDRCSSCYDIEKNVRATIFSHFTKELKKGVIDLHILNCELPENQKLVKKYTAYGSTFAITKFTDGKELTTEDLSAWAFKKSGNKKVFIKELRKIINSNLKT
jgi:hypothetical protein